MTPRDVMMRIHMVKHGNLTRKLGVLAMKKAEWSIELVMVVQRTV